MNHLGAVARTISWWSVSMAMAVSTVGLVLGRYIGGDAPAGFVLLFGLASLAVPLSAGTVLDDDAWMLVASSPQTLRARCRLRVLLAAATVGASWLALVGMSRVLYPRSFAMVDLASSAARVAAVAAGVVAVAALLGRYRHEHVGLVAAAVVIPFAVIASRLVPQSLPTNPRGWLGVVAACAAVTVAAGREPLPS